jgi:hypothetical protein
MDAISIYQHTYHQSLRPSKSLYPRVEVASCNCQPPTSGRPYRCSHNYINEMRHGQFTTEKEDGLQLNGGAIFEGPSLDIKTFTADSIRMDREADFRRGRSVQRQGRQYHSNLERIRKTHGRE